MFNTRARSYKKDSTENVAEKVLDVLNQTNVIDKGNFEDFV